MHSKKFQIQGKQVTLFKRPWKAEVYGKVDKVDIEFNIDNSKVELISGEIEEGILPTLKELISRYFLPIGTPRQRKENK